MVKRCLLFPLCLILAFSFFNCQGNGKNETSSLSFVQTASASSARYRIHTGRYRSFRPRIKRFRPGMTYPATRRSKTTLSVPVTSSSSVVDGPLMAAPIAGEKILKREGYWVSYNTENREPNYVAWTLNSGRLRGNAKRSSVFYEDPELYGYEKATLDDYSYSGFDRGHMCPAGDNKWSLTSMIETFYLSNICPQRHALNAGDWKELEEACRKWVKRDNITFYIIAGPLFNSGQSQYLNRHVKVPEGFFKAILCLTKGDEKGIAFLYHNNSENLPMRQHVTSIDAVEKLTGFDLYNKVSPNEQKLLESQADYYDWR